MYDPDVKNVVFSVTKLLGCRSLNKSCLEVELECRGSLQRYNVEVECKSLQLPGDGQLETCDLSFLFLSAVSGAALGKIKSGLQPDTRGCSSVRVPLECPKSVYFSSGKPVANPVANYTYGGLGVFLY